MLIHCVHPVGVQYKQADVYLAVQVMQLPVAESTKYKELTQVMQVVVLHV